MSLNNFEEQLNKNHASQINLIKYIKQNTDFFNNVGDDFIYKPWINLILRDDQDSFDKFTDSDLSWKYIGEFEFKIKLNGLRQEKIKDITSCAMYKKLLKKYSDELPIDFIEHYTNIDDPHHTLFWDLIYLKKYDTLKIYLQKYTWDPTITINKDYEQAERNNFRNHNNSKHEIFLQMKKAIEIYTDDYVEEPEKDWMHKIIPSKMRNFYNQISDKKGDDKILFYQSIEVNEDNILDIIWKVKQNDGTINLLSVINYFDFMTMSERTEWWNRIQELVPTDLETIVEITSSETFLDYAEDFMSNIDLNKLSSKDNLSEVFINRILKKNPESKNDFIKFALTISNNIGILKFLMPNATSDDILEILNECLI